MQLSSRGFWNKTRALQRTGAIAVAVAALGVVSAMPAAAAVAYFVTVDTSSVNATPGFQDFQFNPGNATSQAATAQITNFANTGGMFTAPPANTGDVSGTLPGPVTFVNDTPFNEYFQPFTYGTSFTFIVTLSGPALDSPNHTATAGTRFCVEQPALTNDPSGCVFTIDINLDGTTTATANPSSTGGPSVVTFTRIGLQGSFQMRYMSNLNIADSVINITNAGDSATALLAPGQTNGPAQNNIDGNICVNIYAFAADEQEVACCSCLVTPNGLYSASVKNFLLNSVLTPSVPNEVVVKLISTNPSVGVGGVQTCNPATVTLSTSASGLLAWGTTAHGFPTAAGPKFSIAETPFSQATLSAAELARDVQECQFIQILGSGQFGICKGCQNAGLGATAQ
jgi:hypothetical protein